MRQGGEPQGVQVVRQGEPTLYHCNFNRLYYGKPTRTVQTKMNPPRHPYLNLQQGNVESYCAIVPKKELPQWHAQGWLPHYVVGLSRCAANCAYAACTFSGSLKGGVGNTCPPYVGTEVVEQKPRACVPHTPYVRTEGFVRATAAQTS